MSGFKGLFSRGSEPQNGRPTTRIFSLTEDIIRICGQQARDPGPQDVVTDHQECDQSWLRGAELPGNQELTDRRQDNSRSPTLPQD
ncbi:hypothetical protein J6590_056262 [Homalodisca vitripennis]|nr:hypothetical protein J6590_056262 [Homalodisca vitripennis]